MTVAQKHLYLTINGDYSGAAQAGETWQVGVRLGLFYNLSGGPDPVGSLPTNWDVSAHSISRTEADWNINGNWWITTLGGAEHFSPDDFLNDQVAPAVTDWALAAGFSSFANINELRLSPINGNGKVEPAPPYAAGSALVLSWTASNPTGSQGNILPLQVSGVVSHRTAQVGRRGRGRMYLPPSSPAALTGSRFTVPQTEAMRDAQVALLEALHVHSGAGAGNWDTYPIITGKPWTQYGIINQVRVDNIPDTQRRRRRSLVGVEISAPVTY